MLGGVFVCDVGRSVCVRCWAEGVFVWKKFAAQNLTVEYLQFWGGLFVTPRPEKSH